MKWGFGKRSFASLLLLGNPPSISGARPAHKQANAQAGLARVSLVINKVTTFYFHTSFERGSSADSSEKQCSDATWRAGSGFTPFTVLPGLDF